MTFSIKPLNKFISLSIGAGCLISLYSLPAVALLDHTDLGVYTGTAIDIKDDVKYKSFADYMYNPSTTGQTKNQGWMHTAKFLTLTVGTEQDIASGKTFDVQLTISGDNSLDAGGKVKNPLDNPSFAIWTAGTKAYSPENAFGQHGWNPTRGPNEEVVNINNAKDKSNMNENFRRIGGLDGHVGWIGFVNSGGEYTLTQHKDPLDSSQVQTLSGTPAKDYVGHGGLNTTDKLWLTQPELSTVEYSNNYIKIKGIITGETPDQASMKLYGLKAGNYLIGLGGSCSYTLNTFCGVGTNFQFKVAPLNSSNQAQNDQAAIAKVLAAGNLNVINTDAVSGQLFIREQNGSVSAPFYAALPDSVASAPTMANVAGLSVAPYMPDKLKNVFVAYAVYQDSQGQLRQKALLPTPAQWEQLRIALLNSDFTNIVLQADGIIAVTASDGTVYKVFADYIVTPGDDNVTKEPKLSFAVINDVNGDGVSDLKVTYPNGDQQILLLLNI